MTKRKYQKGTVIIITFVILTALLFLGVYFLTFSLTESKISRSQGASAQAYYLAEAGVNEAIWKLKNDPSWASDFIDPNKNPYLDGTYWKDEFTHSFGDGSYTVTIQNSACGKGEIVSTSVLPLTGGTAKRVVKTVAFKALGSLTRDSAIFTGGSSENVEITSSQITIYGGNLYCGNILDIRKDSIVEVYDNPATEDDPETEETVENLEGQVLVASNISIKSSILTAEAVCADNFCDKDECALAGTACPPEDTGELPVVDFFSDYPECNPPLNSFKCRAQAAQDTGQCSILCNGILCDTNCVYSSSEFEDLLEEIGQGGTLTLNPDNLRNIIFYVVGPGGIKLDESRHLIVNGTLVADGNIDIGEKGEFSQVVINQPSDSPSGLLAQKRINISYTDFNITGVIYSLKAITIENAQGTFNIQGGIIAEKVNFGSIGQLNITLDNDIILYGLGYLIDGKVVTPDPEFSPTITIDHWEESY